MVWGLPVPASAPALARHGLSSCQLKQTHSPFIAVLIQWHVNKNTEHRTQKRHHGTTPPQADRADIKNNAEPFTQVPNHSTPKLPLRTSRAERRRTRDERRETAARGRHGEGARRGYAPRASRRRASLAVAAEEDARAAFRESTPKSPAKQAPAAPLRAQRDKREDGRGRRREDTAAQSNAPRAQRGGGAAKDKKCCRGHRQRGLGRSALVLVLVLERDVLRIALCSARSARNIRTR